MPKHTLTPQNSCPSIRRIAFSALALASLIACSGGGGSPGPAPEEESGGAGGAQAKGGAGGKPSGKGGAGGTAPSGNGGAGPGGGGAGGSESGGAGGTPAAGGAGGEVGPTDGPPAAGEPDGGPITMPTMPLPSEEVPLPPCKRTVNATGAGDLATAIGAAAAGDCIVLADGSYTFPTITAKGTEANPIVIKAANVLKAVVSTGNLLLQGSAHVIVQGLMWNGSGTIKMMDCDHCRISRFRIQRQENGENDWVSISGTSHHCRIDHNDLGPQNQVSNMVMLSGAGSQIVQYNRVDHNFFHDVHYAGGNGWEIIRAGLSGWTFSSAHNLIEQNLFKSTASDPEVISVKSSDNIVRYNTMRASNGQFTLRHGNRTEVYGNYILGDGVAGSSGLRVYGGNHKIYNNYFSTLSGVAINIDSGTSDDKTGMLTDHKVTYDVQVVFNTIVNGRGISVGSGKPLSPKNITVAYNLLQGAGPLITQTAGTTSKMFGNIVNGTAGVSMGVMALDPKLTKLGDVFSIATGSPAVDAAMEAAMFPFVTEDINGRARTKPDIGAHEVTDVAAKYGLLTEKDVGPLAP